MSSRHHKKHDYEKCANQAPNPGTNIPGVQYGEAAVPYQVYGPVWDPETALKHGTVFPDLYRPYEKRDK